MVCFCGEFQGFRPPYKTPREFGNYSVLSFEKRATNEKARNKGIRFGCQR